MDVPTLRSASAVLILVVAGVTGLGVVTSSQQPAPASVEMAAGSVLALDGTPQPTESASGPPVPQNTFALPARGAGPGTTDSGPYTRPGVWHPVDGGTLVAPANSVAPAATAPRATTPSKPRARARAGSAYSGSNHVWIPSLGISRAVWLYPCSRNKALAPIMYRWGCAGRNNVYLMGHAYAPMKPLHDAYGRGTLKLGMRAYYADGAGRVRTYAAIWWRVTAPRTSGNWPWAAQRTPSMTLQTCVGSRSQYRLIVRLVEVPG